MPSGIRREAHYQYRRMRLLWAFLTRGFIHCNLQITYRCNFRCQICDFWKTGQAPDEELSLADIRLIGRKLDQLGSLIVSLAGGEPLIRDDIYDIILALNECNQFPILITNGWFVNETVAKDILRCGLQEISVSVDYANPDRHDRQRGKPGSWERAVRALELLNRHRPDRRNRVHLISVLMDDNLDEVEDLIRLSRDLGVTYMVNLYSWSRGTKKPRLPGQKVTDYLLGLKEKYAEFITLTSYIEQLDRAIDEGGIGNCQTGRLQFNIDNHGNVSRCPDTSDEVIGNILTEATPALRRRMDAARRARDCNHCWTSCRGFAESMFRAPRWRQIHEFQISVKRH